MKKVFVSQPMRGKTDAEILEERHHIEEQVKERFGDDATVLDTFFEDYSGDALGFLGHAISVLSQADCAIFGKGWEDARGCRIEHLCCVEYGIEVIE